MNLEQLVLRALELGLMIHGGGPAETGRSESGIVYTVPVYSVLVSCTTKRSIVVYSCSTNEDHKEAVVEALTNAIERAESKVIQMGKKK